MWRILLDDLGTSWRVGLSLGEEWSWGDSTWKAFGALDGDWGPKEFTYYPDAGKDPASRFTHSYSVGTSGFLQQTVLRKAPWALQLKAVYAKDWKEADKVGVVSDGTPALVEKQVVVDPPARKATLFTRLFYYRRLTSRSNFAVGPTLAVSASSKSGHGSPLSDKVIGRIELWLYYLPLANVPNIRVGFAPFLDGYFEGRSPDDNRSEPGLLVQLKFASEVFLY